MEEEKELVEIEDSPTGREIEDILIKLNKYCLKAKSKIEKLSNGKYNLQVILKFLD